MTQMIAGKDKKIWRFHAIEIIDEGEVDGPISANDVLLPCSKDDEYIFYNNDEKTFEYTSGTIKCDISQEDVLLSDAWSYTTANATLEFAFPIDLFGAVYVLPFTVKSLTDTEMVLEVYFTKVFVEEINASYRVTLRSDGNQ